VGEFRVTWNISTVPLTWFSRNTVFSRNQNARKSGNRCRSLAKKQYYKKERIVLCELLELSKSAKVWVSKSIFYVKNQGNLSSFFFIEEYRFRSTLFIIDIFWQPQSLNTFFLKWYPIFDSPLHQFTKYNGFLLEYWFLANNLSKFVSLPWKLDNLYYHVVGASEAHFHRATTIQSPSKPKPVIAKFAEIQSPLLWTRPMPQVTHIFQVFSINTKMHFVL
jgi:hypothetical protein